MGYKQNEEEDAYFKRMCAILALYCAIMQAVPLIPSKYEKLKLNSFLLVYLNLISFRSS